MTTNPRQPARLRLAEPAAELPDTRAEVARALLDRYAPVAPVVDDQASAVLGTDRAATARFEGLQSDPRYLIGRLTQALTALLERDVPPMDATAQLLTAAIADAVAYRMERVFACGCGDECSRCVPEGRQAELYRGLEGRLGLIDELPAPPAPLTVVTR